MELQFETVKLELLQVHLRQACSLEQTQQLKLPEGYPDVGRVLGVWGQCLLRGKQWQTETVSVSGGCCVRILYAPEEGGPVQSVEHWLPFQHQWSIAPGTQDGVLAVNCILSAADARPVSGRKLTVRTCVDLQGVVCIPQKLELPTSGELDPDIHILTQEKAFGICTQAGEKSFTLEETLTLPQTNQPMEKLLYATAQPRITEHRVMTDKMIFRGENLLHMLYRGTDGQLHSWDFVLPFSQYAALDREQTDAAEAWILPQVTDLQLTQGEDKLQLQLSLTGQYLIRDVQPIRQIRDAYSNIRPLELQMAQLCVPTISFAPEQCLQITCSAEQSAASTSDALLLPGIPDLRQEPPVLDGQLQLLWTDLEEATSLNFLHWQQTLPQTPPMPLITGYGPAQAENQAQQVSVSCPVFLSGLDSGEETLTTLCAITAQQDGKPDPERPSLILRRAQQDSLWQLAKSCGSTVEAICRSNNLLEEPDPQQLLLIPVE